MSKISSGEPSRELSAGQRAWLERIAVRGTWPDRPFLKDPDSAIPLMRLGLVEAIKPAAPYLPYVAITEAGREALRATDGRAG